MTLSLSNLWTPFHVSLFFLFSVQVKLSFQWHLFVWFLISVLLAFVVFHVIFLIQRFSINLLKRENKDLLLCHCWELKRVFFFPLVFFHLACLFSLSLSRLLVSLSSLPHSSPFMCCSFIPFSYFSLPSSLCPVLCSCLRLCEFW